MIRASFSRAMLIAASVLLLTSLMSAQVSIGGNVFDGAGGPLLSGVVYKTTSSLTVPAGQTLTIQSGAIVKFRFGDGFSVYGHLAVTGNAGNRAVFTEIADDSIGGDTNLNGPSSGSVGAWRGIEIQAGATASIAGLEARYCGYAGYPVINLKSVQGITITNSLLRDYNSGGIHYGAGSASVSQTVFQNGNLPVVSCKLEDVANFTNNTATGHSVHDCVEIVASTSSSSITIPASSVMSGAHVLTGTQTISAGAVVDIDPGVVFKAKSSGVYFNVHGTLNCNGAAGNPVVFTDFRDDSYGGDCNKDGSATAPAIGKWRGFNMNAGSGASSFSNTVLRYTGYAGYAAFELDADITIDSCFIQHGSANGIDLNATSQPTITDTDIQSVGTAITGATFAALENFSGNSASNCSSWNCILITHCNSTTSVSFGTDNLISSTAHVNANATVAAGTTMTISDGAVLKFNNGTQFQVDGTLVCDGTGGEIVFTARDDDSHGGDTNADGPSVASPGNWYGVLFNSTADASTMDKLRVRMAGYAGAAGVRIVDADIAITDSIIEDCSHDALSLQNSNAMPTVSGCAFDRCRSAVVQLEVHQVANFTNNTASNNSYRDNIRVEPSTLSVSATIVPANQINGAIEQIGNLNIQAGGQLDLAAGVVFKMSSGGSRVDVSGRLTCSGTPTSPVSFTTITDDSFAGDTNKDGASTGAKAYWRGLAFHPGSDASMLEHALVRYGGYAGDAGIECFGSNFSMRDSRVYECQVAAFDFNATMATPIIENCRFDDSQHSVVGLRWDNLVHFRDNSATGNSTYDSPWVNATEIAGHVSVQADSMIEGCFVCTVAPVVEAGESLSFERGVVLKFPAGFHLSSGNGALHFRGTGAEPVVLTALIDDDWAGDTQHNGQTSGAPAYWYGLSLQGGAAETLEYTLIRYGGYAGVAACKVDNPQARVDAVRVEHAYYDGFQLFDCAGSLDNLVAFDCGQDGIDMSNLLSGGDLRFATVTGCGTGIRFANWISSTIQSTISWGNTTNYVDVVAGQLFDSDGHAGLASNSGNIDVDPLFVNAGIGDLNLGANSPCIDAGNFDLGKLVAGDHVESSRVNDHDFDGVVGADMGAYEFCNWTMTFTGRPKIAESMTFTLHGMPALAVISIALLDYEYYYHPYGMVLYGSPLTLMHQDIWYVGFPYTVPIPNDPYAVGYRFGVQMGCGLYGNLGVGNIANLWRGQIRD